MEVSHTNLFWWLFFNNLHYSHYTPDWERTYKTDRFSCIGPDLELGLFHIIRTRKNIKKFDKSLVRKFNKKCDPLIKQHICLNNEIFIVLLKAVHVNILKCIDRSAVLHVSIWSLSPTYIYIIYSSLNKLGKGIAKYLVSSLVTVRDLILSSI